MKNPNKPRDATYVGRPSRFGNPFEIGRDGCREEVIEKYEARLLKDSWLMAQVLRLRGKDLVCWCSSYVPCHADVLLRLANGDKP